MDVDHIFLVVMCQSIHRAFKLGRAPEKSLWVRYAGVMASGRQAAFVRIFLEAPFALFCFFESGPPAVSTPLLFVFRFRKWLSIDAHGCRAIIWVHSSMRDWKPQ